MHPIERLRYVARATGADPRVLVHETAGALAGLGLDPAGIVTACRRIVERHPTSGPLWWLCSRVLVATDPMREAWACSREIDADTSGDELVYALPDEARVCVLGWPGPLAEVLVRRGDLDVVVVDVAGEGASLIRRLRRSDVMATEVPAAGLGAAASSCDLVLIEADALGPTGMVAAPGALAAAATAYAAQVPVWVLGGVGRALAAPVFDALVRRAFADVEPWEADIDVVPAPLLTHVVGPAGVVDAAVLVEACATACPVAPELFKTTAF